MKDELKISYDELPYESKPIYRTHPDGLATLGTVFGLETPPVPTCRVLELGCASGGNLVPMAINLPEAHFLGIDLSPRQIADGQEMLKALDIRNVELQALDLMEFDTRRGKFDYILCHGVYSWVPTPVQERILQLCQELLTPHGMVYLSYNTYPGWHLRSVARDLMRFHRDPKAPPREQIRQGLEALGFLETILNTGESITVYGAVVREEAQMLREQHPSYLYHEQLEAFNQPVHFHEMAARTAAHGLEYLAEAQFNPLDHNVPPDLEEKLTAWAGDDLIRREQYLDFVRNRTFRRSVFVRAGRSPDRQPSPDLVENLSVAALARPRSEQPETTTDKVEEFAAPDGARLSTNDPLIKTALAFLFSRWPRPVPFLDLWEAVTSHLPDADARDGRMRLRRALLHCYLSNVVELHVCPPAFSLQISDRPRASPLARWQAARGEPIASLTHRVVQLDPIDRLLLPHCDGSNDRAALIEILAGHAGRGVFEVKHENTPLEGEALRTALRGALTGSLGRLTASALMLG